MPLLTPVEWHSFLARHPGAHLLQTETWGELKAGFGWEPAYVGEGEAGALILFRRLPLGLRLAYLPRGPVGVEAELSQFWKDVDELCRSRRAVFLKVEPDGWETAVDQASPPPGFRLSPHSIQPPRTIVLDLDGGEEAILARMKGKTRYNIRLATKKGVIVRPSSDLETFHRLIQATGERDRFGVHSLAYYRRAYELFYPRGECELFLAEFAGEPLGGLMVFARGARAWYLYGASADAHRDLMPNYLLQWEGMRWARSCGCTEYDLWGVPDADEATLEASFLSRSDGLWGVYRFKRGFGGELRRSPGPWDRVYNPAPYSFYLRWLSRRERAPG